MRKDLIHMKMLPSLFLLVMPAIAAAIEMGGIVFAEFLQNAAVWLVSAVPFAAVVAAVWGVWRIIRRKKSRK